MAFAEQLVLACFLAFGATLWFDAAQTMRDAQRSLARSGQRIDYAEAALKEIHRETSALRRLQKEKAGLRQAEARLNEATTLLLSQKNLFAKETAKEAVKETAKDAAKDSAKKFAQEVAVV